MTRCETVVLTVGLLAGLLVSASATNCARNPGKPPARTSPNKVATVTKQPGSAKSLQQTVEEKNKSFPEEAWKFFLHKYQRRYGISPSQYEKYQERIKIFPSLEDRVFAIRFIGMHLKDVHAAQKNPNEYFANMDRTFFDLDRLRFTPNPTEADFEQYYTALINRAYLEYTARNYSRNELSTLWNSFTPVQKRDFGTGLRRGSSLQAYIRHLGGRIEADGTIVKR